jgi:2-hydroxychromene-2-carboxylate isomerase
VTADLHFYFDPVCPFSWLTSQWVRSVAAQRQYEVEWRFLSLRLLNRQVDYDTHFPPEAEGSHTAGLQLLRVAARARAEHGVPAVGPLYASLGAQLWQGAPDERDLPSRIRPVVAASLAECGLPKDLSAAMSDSSWDAGLQAETDQAMALVGEGVGTPVLHFGPPDGVAFCGPVISRLPEKDRAVELWDSVVALARFEGFAALRRNVPESPQLPALAST